MKGELMLRLNTKGEKALSSILFALEMGVLPGSYAAAAWAEDVQVMRERFNAAIADRGEVGKES